MGNRMRYECECAVIDAYISEYGPRRSQGIVTSHRMTGNSPFESWVSFFGAWLRVLA